MGYGKESLTREQKEQFENALMINTQRIVIVVKVSTMYPVLSGMDSKPTQSVPNMRNGLKDQKSDMRFLKKVQIGKKVLRKKRCRVSRMRWYRVLRG